MNTHPTVFVPELEAEVDVEVVELVNLLNRKYPVKTTSSCQGGDNYMGHVAFICPTGDYRFLAELIFGELALALKPLLGDVCLTMDMWGHREEGWIKFNSESISQIVVMLKG